MQILFKKDKGSFECMTDASLIIDLWAFQPKIRGDFTGVGRENEQFSERIQRQSARREEERRLLKAVLGIKLQATVDKIFINQHSGGKPWVDGCEFSISHSGAWLVIATSGQVVGVDIETHRDRSKALALAERFFSAADFQMLRLCSQREQSGFFLRQWVAKEAALKCAGTGIAHHLNLAECRLGGNAIREVVCEETSYAIHEFNLPDGTPGAVAWRGEERACIRWREAAELQLS